MAHATRRERRKVQRGTASLEALLLLPVFLILWLGVFHMYKVQGSVLIARAQARRCAWRYSNAGCRGAAPPGCGDMSASDTALVAAGENDGNIDGVLAALGPLGSLFEGVLGSAANVRVSRDVKKTSPIVAEDGAVGASIYLLCNEKNRSTAEIAQDTACALTESGSFLASTLGCNGERTWPEEAQ